MNLDELKKKLIAALPPVIREKLGASVDDDEDDVDVDEVTGEHEIAASEASEDDESEEGEDEEEEVDDEEARKKSIRSQIIRGVAVLGLTYYVATEYILVEEAPPSPPPPVARATPQPTQTPIPTAEETPQETPVAIATQEPMVEETPFESVVEIPPETPSEVLSDSDTSFEETLAQETPEAMPEETPEVETFLGQSGEVETPPTPVAPSENFQEEETSAGGLDALIEAVSESDKRAREEAGNTKLSRNDPSYVKPPNYLRAGRGLVYNCVEGHWACVDKFSYFTCFENQNWNKDNGHQSECVTRDVYASLKDCSAVQKFYVNKPEPTDFCQGENEANNNGSANDENDLSNLMAP